MAIARITRISEAITLLITIFSLSLPAYAQYSGGTGEPNDPYQISTAEDLMLLGETPEDYDKHFILTADIDLDPNLPGRKVFDRAVVAPAFAVDFYPFVEGIPFTGVLNGNGRAITHLTVIGESCLGLFGLLHSGAKISKLGLEAVYVSGSGDHIGGLVGYIDSYSTITVSYSRGMVSGSVYVGGLAGYSQRSAISNCYSTGTVSGTSTIGGLVGRNIGSISNSYSNSIVSGDEFIGGLVGNDELVHPRGLVVRGSCTRSYWDVEASGQATSAGGTGKTTNEMKEITTFLAEGWDFDDEILNGTCDYWQISAGDYPKLHYQNGDIPVMPDGLGTAEKPYLIRDIRDLGTIWSEPLAHYRLETSLDLSSISWSAAVVPWFGGVFDGNGCVISNLHIEGDEYLGLFGYAVYGAEISNLGLEVVDVNGTAYVGSLVGSNSDYWMSGGALTDCYSTGSVRGESDVGGLVGSNNGNITASQSSSIVTGNERVGGLVGSGSGNIIDSYTTGTVTGDRYIGGLIGSGHGSILASYTSGTVAGDTSIGGLAGYNSGSINSCYSTVPVIGTDNVGGLVGVNGSYGNITMSHSTGSVSGINSVGGLAGFDSGSIIASYASGTVAGDAYVGGLVGSISGNIIAGYSNGSIIGNEGVGGLVGNNDRGSITISYSTGIVNGSKNVGGLVGNEYKSSITSSFWDIESSGQATSAGGTGKTTTEMKEITTFLAEGWDFDDEILNGTCDYWQISSGDYPMLHYQISDMPVMPDGLGTAEKPYLVRDARDLGTIWSEPLAHYRLEKSLDLSSITWSAAVVPWFGGVFDGNGCVISNLHIEGDEHLGLFGYAVYGAEISNLGLEVVDVNGTGIVGGLVGWNEYGSITSCYSSGVVRGGNSSSGIGGLVGCNVGSITTSYSNCMVSGMRLVGGLAGFGGGSIIRSYSTGLVNGDNWEVGGLVGKNLSGIISESFWNIWTSGQVTSDGGTGITTIEMRKAKTFLEAGWDFVGETENGTDDIWNISEGLDYPRLWWEAN